MFRLIANSIAELFSKLFTLLSDKQTKNDLIKKESYALKQAYYLKPILILKLY